MRNLELYFENPFDNIVASKEKIIKFFDHHVNSLIQRKTEGVNLDALIPPSVDALAALKTSLQETAIKVAEQISKTLTVDECIELFVAKAKDFEAGVRDKYKKDSPVYKEFYPQGMKLFNHITKKNIEEVMAQFISAFDVHQADIGVAKFNELKQIRSSYVLARATQEQKKTETLGKRSSWEDNLKKMNTQAFTNLLTIVQLHKAQPQKAKIYFNQSIVARPKHNQDDQEAQPLTEKIAPNTTITPDMIYSADDTILLSNVSDSASIYWYGGSTANEAPNTKPTELLPGEEIEIPAATLGKYLILLNKDTVNTAEVEIMLV
ncbi:MAG: hypothetical protein HXX18_03020 [Bacteroidetes bacterium]|nr:hypothetical protein [Bacteroidota bacterium]